MDLLSIRMVILFLRVTVPSYDDLHFPLSTRRGQSIYYKLIDICGQ